MNNTIQMESLSYDNMSVNVQVLWSAGSKDILKYYVRFHSILIDMVNNITTFNNSITFNALYNQEYRITVVGNNCAGNSTPISTDFIIGRLSLFLLMFSCLN